MTKPKLTIALGHYDHVTDLVTGRIPIPGADVNYIQFDRPAEIHYRFILYKDFDAAEISLGKLASMISQGQNDFVGLPVFTSRLPRHASLFVRRDGPVQKPEDLAGKRIGLPEWAQTAAIYTRGLLQHQYGIDLTGVRWIQAGRVEKVELKLPAGLSIEPRPSGNLSDMLMAGELDAVMSANTPEAFVQGDPNIRRLFEDYASAEQAYVAETGIFPIMHMLAVKREALERDPWLALELFKAFEKAKNNSLARMFEVQSAVPVPWAYEHARAQQKIFGKDLWPYGVAPNRRTLEGFMQFAHEQGVCHRLLAPEDIFATQTVAKVSV